VTPEQLALYAPGRGLSRNDLPMAAQLEYDRLRPAWERGEALPVWDREAARLAWEAQHPPEAAGRGHDIGSVARLVLLGSEGQMNPVAWARFQTGHMVHDDTLNVTH
jgi:hypothetical protein